MGPFFRMNNLSQDEINTQLFFFAKEAIRTIVLESKCGLVSSIKSYKRLSSNNDISINSNISPLLCVYKRLHLTISIVKIPMVLMKIPLGKKLIQQLML